MAESIMKEVWIWLPKDYYPADQTTKFDTLSSNANDTFVVAEFKKEYMFERQISSVTVRFSADTEVQLF